MLATLLKKHDSRTKDSSGRNSQPPLPALLVRGRAGINHRESIALASRRSGLSVRSE
jgi:hypothetical protein